MGHFIQMGKPKVEHSYKDWKSFVNQNKDKVHKKKDIS